MYKKIYLEVTNNCNLNCSFCTKNKRIKKFISIEDYLKILDKIKGYTKYLYLHISGEPLMHPQINELINLGSKNFHINITTNGYLIKRIYDNHNIRQINISLHSFNPEYKINLNDYMHNIIDVINNLKNDTYISLRFWTYNKYNEEIIKILASSFQVKIELKNNFKIVDNVYISIGHEFIWPSLDSDVNIQNKTCYALRDHLGILVDGTIIPCCLDTEGIIQLGNIFNEDLTSVINSQRYQTMLKGFQSNKRIEKLCQKCNFLSDKN